MNDDSFEMDEELLSIFLTESGEGLDTVEKTLIELETDPENDGLLAAIFRTMHTIKGNSGFLGLDRLGKIAHAGESLLSTLRSVHFHADEDVISLLLETADAVRVVLTGIEAEGKEPDFDHKPLVLRLQAAERRVGAPAGGLEKGATVKKTPPLKPARKSRDTAPARSGNTKQATPEASAPPPPVTKNVSAAKPQGNNSIRVDLGLLDGMMNQVSELVLSRNRLMQLTAQSASPELINTCRDINHVTEQLQEQLLSTRMQPISTIWGTLPRIVRDIGKQLEKKIRVVMEGQDTELDRTILAAIKDPLTHIIRNSCDHGIESPEKRKELHKPVEGTLSLLASQQSGFVLITITDDGGGIDAERIKDKAIKMGVLSEQQAQGMSDKAALQLIFNAGLSTAEKVSSLSGRGVGMDVVRTEIEAVGGSVEILSEPGSGTTLNIRIPLTLAIISTMIVGCGEHRFAIPQMNVKELLAAHADSENWRHIANHPFFQIRDNLLPIVCLNNALKLGIQVGESGSIVVVDTGDRLFGIAVDKIYGAEEIVVKPLGAHFQHLGIYSGCSILGDGRVVPILECNGLSQLINLAQQANSGPGQIQQQQENLAHERQHTLVFIHAEQRYAIPLALVERLEYLTSGSIQESGNREVLQYRGDVIPILRWGEIMGLPVLSESSQILCLILADGEKRICLQVDRIAEILEVPVDIKLVSNSAMFLGTVVIKGKATEFVDALEILKLADPHWFTSTTAQRGKKRERILFVEDTTFFRGLLIPMLEASGYETWVARDGAEACKVLEMRVPDLILTDLEMPNMDGYQLASWVRNNSGLAKIPIVALTARPPGNADVEKRSCFNDVLEKQDRHTLLERIGQLLGRNARVEHITGAEDAFDSSVLVQAKAA